MKNILIYVAIGLLTFSCVRYYLVNDIVDYCVEVIDQTYLQLAVDTQKEVAVPKEVVAIRKKIGMFGNYKTYTLTIQLIYVSFSLVLVHLIILLITKRREKAK